MAIRFRCPAGHSLSIGEEYAGKRLRCPRCLAPTQIPTSSTAAETGTRRAGSPRNAERSVDRRQSAIAPPAAAPAQASLPESASSPDDFEQIIFGDLHAVPKPAGALAAPTEKLLSRPPARPVDRNGVELSPRPSPAAQQTSAARRSPSQPALHAGSYRADKHQVHTVYLLGLALALVAAFQLGPVLGRYGLSLASAWARLVLFLALVQLAYTAWMVLAPDWTSVRVAMLVFAGATTIYSLGLALAVMTPPGSESILDMDDVLRPARWWCSTVLILCGLMTYVCGHVSHRWRKRVRAAGVLAANV